MALAAPQAIAFAGRFASVADLDAALAARPDNEHAAHQQLVRRAVLLAADGLHDAARRLIDEYPAGGLDEREDQAYRRFARQLRPTQAARRSRRYSGRSPSVRPRPCRRCRRGRVLDSVLGRSPRTAATRSQNGPSSRRQGPVAGRDRPADRHRVHLTLVRRPFPSEVVLMADLLVMKNDRSGARGSAGRHFRRSGVRRAARSVLSGTGWRRTPTGCSLRTRAGYPLWGQQAASPRLSSPRRQRRCCFALG